VNAKAMAKMSEQEHIFYLLQGVPRKDECKVFLVLMMKNNAKMTAKPNEIITTKLISKEATITREKRLAPEALLCAKKGGRGGRGGRGGKVSRSPKRDNTDDKRDNKGDNTSKEKDFRKCIHCQLQGHTTEKHLSKQYGIPPKAAHTAAQSSTETTPTITTSIKNYWMLANSNASPSNWFIDCGCTTHISGCQSMCISYT
jgi:hypothetical protein